MKTIPSIKADTAKQGVLTGISQAAPIALGYVPIGIAFGILAQEADIAASNTLLMSLLVFAGSSQLIAVGMVKAGSPALSIIIATFVVNLRHLLMSAAISPFLNRLHKGELAAFAYQLTDETFAVHSTRFASIGPNKAEAFTTNVSSQLAWVLGTWLGIVLGQRISDAKHLALDYALPAMFVALLVLQIKDRILVAVAFLSGSLAVGLLLIGVDQWHVILATLIGASIGVGLEKWIRKPSS
jgi:4-azaleucine resistance transporter AzlC